MQLRSAVRSSAPAMGFTLIELMVVVAIATILFSIAIPSYMTYIRQSRRTEAKTAVLELAGREERFLSTNPTAYTSTANALGYGTAAVPLTNFPVGSGYYQVTVCSPACAPSAIATFPRDAPGRGSHPPAPAHPTPRPRRRGPGSPWVRPCGYRKAS